MDFLQTLQAHTGGLIRIKSELYWYGGRGWDGSPGRVCLVLDAADRPGAVVAVAVGAVGAVVVLLLIDDRPQWVWVTEADVELIA